MVSITFYHYVEIPFLCRDYAKASHLQDYSVISMTAIDFLELVFQ